MTTTGRQITAVLLVLLLLAAGVQLWRKSSECRQQAQRIDVLYRQAKALEASAAISSHQLDSLQSRMAGLVLSPIHPGDINELRKRGLQDPVAILIANLQEHRELIPFPGLEGSKMGFYDVDRIRVLSDSWVYAPFEDGHIGGEAILEYEVAPGGAISWRIVKARLDS